MAVYTRRLLSGSTSGRPIPVAANATPGTTLHAAVSGTTAFDEVYLWASNVTAASATLYVEWGGATDPGDHLVKNFSIGPNSGPVPVATGIVLNGNVSVAAFCTAASAINVTGYVNRIV